jgi:hypothetical protein
VSQLAATYHPDLSASTLTGSCKTQSEPVSGPEYLAFSSEQATTTLDRTSRDVCRIGTTSASLI